ncbi:MAG: FAD-binding oxidoreductase [Myxococcota bacterium]|nr:FAD-binding oxidoreductase [Myxococcota bacterium]
MDLITDSEIIAGYLTDASNTTGYADALLRPRDAQEVSSIVKMCQQYSIPLTVTAQRTSTTGGPVPEGGWLLSTELLNRIHSQNEVDAGVLMGEYQRFTESKGLLFPPDPTSRNECTIGAAIACNASGARSFRYGPTRSWIEAVEVVLPSGEIMIADRTTPIPSTWPMAHWSPPSVKTAAGYHPAENVLDLMIGQEGTLGIVTKAWTRLIDVPSEVLGMIIYFASVENCIACVESLRIGAHRPHVKRTDGSLNPRAIEYFDHHSIELIRQRVEDLPHEAVCGLFVEVEHEGEIDLDAWFEVFERHEALCDDIIAAEDEPSRQKLYQIRHAIPAGVNEIVVANGMPKIGTDFSVPDTGLREMMDSYASVPMRHILFGHIGDNHLHLNLLPSSKEELAHAKDLYRELALQAVSLGGTVSAEHGIGKIKRNLLADMVGSSVIDGFRLLKQHLDPNWILCRGVLFNQKD